jgi:hypothetical protein
MSWDPAAALGLISRVEGYALFLFADDASVSVSFSPDELVNLTDS